MELKNIQKQSTVS